MESLLIVFYYSVLEYLANINCQPIMPRYNAAW